MVKKMQKICVVGLGYIGLPSASLLATKGYHVHGVDINPSIVEALTNGNILIHEPSLDIMVKSAVSSGRLTADIIPKQADIFILAVPTPFHDGFIPNVEYIHSACKSIAPFLQPGNLVILESTSPVGTTEKVSRWLIEERPDLNFPCQDPHTNKEQVYIAHCPERVIPGRILEELISNDRVIGGMDEASTKKTVSFYNTFVQGEVCSTNSHTAELVKLTENAFRDVNLAFANELSLICQKLNINVWETIQLANRHPRVNILQPGPGVGGHCIAVDPWFIISSMPDEARLLHSARQVNMHKPKVVLDTIIEKTKNFNAPKIACFGLSYKANTDDLRESPALAIVEKLATQKAMKLFIVEPYITKLPNNLKAKATLSSAEEAIANADIIVFLVKHSAFKEINKDNLSDRIIIDTVGLLA